MERFFVSFFVIFILFISGASASFAVNVDLANDPLIFDSFDTQFSFALTLSTRQVRGPPTTLHNASFLFVFPTTTFGSARLLPLVELASQDGISLPPNAFSCRHVSDELAVDSVVTDAQLCTQTVPSIGGGDSANETFALNFHWPGTFSIDFEQFCYASLGGVPLMRAAYSYVTADADGTISSNAVTALSPAAYTGSPRPHCTFPPPTLGVIYLTVPGSIAEAVRYFDSKEAPMGGNLVVDTLVRSALNAPLRVDSVTLDNNGTEFACKSVNVNEHRCKISDAAPVSPLGASITVDSKISCVSPNTTTGLAPGVSYMILSGSTSKRDFVALDILPFFSDCESL